MDNKISRRDALKRLGAAMIGGVAASAGLFTLSSCRADKPRKRVVLYFTGTGNCLYVARELAGKDGEILSIPQLARKGINEIEANEQRWESYQAEDADVVLVAYGISSRISKEAVNMARAEGFKLGLIRPITLWPYPVKAFETCKNAKAFMTVEINILGQMVDDVKLAVENKYPVGFYGTFFGLPEPEEIVAQAKAMLDKEGK